MPFGYADPITNNETKKDVENTINREEPILKKIEPTKFTGITNTISSKTEPLKINTKTEPQKEIKEEEKTGVLKRLFTKKDASDKDEKTTEETKKTESEEINPEEITPVAKEVSSDKITDLEKNAQAMKDKENSIENRTLTAAAIGATGYGVSQLLEGKAEESADEAAERDMKAHLATFQCDYGEGRNIKGGEKEVVLPGANVLTPLYTEYKTLAAELKTTKEALGLAPGIESEKILDKATTGLYDNKSIGKTGGAFVSVSDALTGDAAAGAAWDAQKSAAAQKVQTGMIAAGAGIAAGAIGNMLINGGKDAVKENSDEINSRKYETITVAAEELQTEITEIKIEKIDCGTDATEVEGSCECNDTNKIYTEGKCVDKPISVDCGTDKLAFKTTDNKCACTFGFEFVNKKCVCNSPKEIDGIFCKIKEFKSSINFVPSNNFKLPIASSSNSTVDDNVEQETTKITQITLPSQGTFNPNESNIKDPFKGKLVSFAEKVKENQTDVCYLVSGNTDKTGSEAINNALSKKRAENVGKILIDNGINSNNIKTVGNGWINCTTIGLKSDENCRNVTIEILANSCTS